MGGKPNSGTKKDKRLKENKNPLKVSTKKQSTPPKDNALIFKKMTGSKPADPTL